MVFSPQFSPLKRGPDPGLTVLCPGEDSLPPPEPSSSSSLRNLPTQDGGATLVAEAAGVLAATL